MKTLTIRSPWAQNIIRDGKNIENRSWQTLYRGPLLIHVSKTPHTPESGMIIGVVDLVDCLPPDNRSISGNKWAEPGYYHWVLENPRELKTKIPIKGKLSIWEYDLDPKELKKVL
jgi:hypothetical protein